MGLQNFLLQQSREWKLRHNSNTNQKLGEIILIGGLVVDSKHVRS